MGSLIRSHLSGLYSLHSTYHALVAPFLQLFWSLSTQALLRFHDFLAAFFRLVKAGIMATHLSRAHGAVRKLVNAGIVG